MFKELTGRLTFQVQPLYVGLSSILGKQSWGLELNPFLKPNSVVP